MSDATKRVEEFLEDHAKYDGSECLDVGYGDDIDLRTSDIRAIIEENTRLRKDADRLDYLMFECNDLVCVADPIADTGDADTVWEVAGHFMQKPCRRILAVSSDPRAAIDKAMASAQEGE